MPTLVTDTSLSRERTRGKFIGIHGLNGGLSVDIVHHDMSPSDRNPICAVDLNICSQSCDKRLLDALVQCSDGSRSLGLRNVELRSLVIVVESVKLDMNKIIV
jgi:hypothetical protein